MKVCRCCYRRIDDCCVHEWAEVPDGCVCAGAWTDIDDIPPVCSSTPCSCEHDEECHAKEKR